MLEQMRRGSKWMTVIFVAVIGGVFVFFVGLGQPLNSDAPAAGSVIQIGDVYVDRADYLRTRAQQQQQMQDRLGPEALDRLPPDFIDAQTLRLLVDRAILTHAAGELGLVTSDQEIRDWVRDSGGFRDADGRFDQEEFEARINWEYGSQSNFVDSMRRDLLADKLVRLLQNQAFVSDQEVQTAARQSLEGVRIAYVALDTADTSNLRPVSDEDAAAYLEQNREKVKAEYDANGVLYTEPDKVRASHVLLSTGPGAEEAEIEAARAKAEAALARIREGASFDEIAVEVSEDETTAAQAGDLGFFARGDTNPALDSAFDREVGEISEVLRSDRGFHIVRTDEFKEGGVIPFEEAGLSIARKELLNAAAAENARELAEALSQKVRDGSSLEEAAREQELTLERTGVLRRRADGLVEGLGGGSPELLATAFTLDLESPSSPEVFEVGRNLVLVQLISREEADETEVLMVADQQREALLNQKRQAIFQAWIDQKREQLEANQQLLVDTTLVSGS